MVYASDLRAACEARGVRFGVWDPEPTPGSGTAAVASYDAQFYIAQAEAPGDWVAIAEQSLAVPKAIVTTLFGQNAESTRALVANGWKCLTECYLSEGDTFTPDRMNYEAYKLGWPATQPVFGCYHGKTMEDYQQWINWRGWSIWSAEYVW